MGFYPAGLSVLRLVLVLGRLCGVALLASLQVQVYCKSNDLLPHAYTLTKGYIGYYGGPHPEQWEKFAVMFQTALLVHVYQFV